MNETALKNVTCIRCVNFAPSLTRPFCFRCHTLPSADEMAVGELTEDTVGVEVYDTIMVHYGQCEHCYKPAEWSLDRDHKWTCHCVRCYNREHPLSLVPLPSPSCDNSLLS